MGGALALVKESRMKWITLLIMESLLANAVNLFMMISGYFLCESNKRNLWKPIELIVQTMLMKGLLQITGAIVHKETISLSFFVGAFIPNNYFVILYCSVFIVSPYVNMLMWRLSAKGIKRMIIILMTVFCAYPTLVDAVGNVTGANTSGLSSIGLYGSQWGYTIVNFMLMYTVGAYIKKEDFRLKRLKIWQLISCLIVIAIVLAIWSQTIDKNSSFVASTAWEYCNPFVVLEAMLILILFNKIHIGSSKAINSLAKGAFTVYLVHATLLNHIDIERFVTKGYLMMLGHIVLSAIGIYMICYIVYLIYTIITKRIFAYLSMRIPLTYNYD